MNNQFDELAKGLGRFITLAATLLEIWFISVSSCSAQVQQAWLTRYDGPAHSNDFPLALALDATGNLYVIGESLAANGSPDYATVKYDSNGNQVWAARYNGPGNDRDYPGALAIDNLGNVYVAGESWSASTDFDFATIKYDRDGRQLWVRRYNGPANRLDSGGPVALDSAGNVYVTGNSENTNGIVEVVTIKYDTNGNQLWAARYNSPTPGNWNSANSIVVDTTGNVYVNGFSRYSIHFDYNTLKYNSDGLLLWTARYDGPANLEDQAGAIAVDDSGNVYVTGWSEGSGTAFDCVTIKYDSNGNQLWVARYNGPGNTNDFGSDIAVDNAGNVCVTGIVDSDGWGGGDFLTIKYSPNGDQLWLARYDGPANNYDDAATLAVDQLGNIYVAGFSDEGDSHYHWVVVKYDTSGNQLWVDRYDGPERYDAARRLALDASGNVFVTGFSYGNSGADFTTIKYVQSPAAPRLDAPTLLPSGQFGFTLLGETGRSYTIEASTDLMNWTAMTNFVSVTGTNLVTDVPDLNQKFYRAFAH